MSQEITPVTEATSTDWNAIIEGHLEKLEGKTDPAEELATLREVARIFERELDDAGRAYTTLLLALHSPAADVALARELARLAGKAGVLAAWLDEYATFVAGLEDRTATVAHGLSLGRMLQDTAGGAPAVLRSFERVLGADAGNREALAGIAELARTTDDSAVRAQLFHRAAVGFEERLGDTTTARELLAACFAADPGHMDAAIRLAAHHETAGRHDQLLPVLHHLAAAAETAGETARARDLRLRVAACARALGQVDDAIEAFQVARRHGPVSAETLRSLADLHRGRGEWAAARAVFDDLLTSATPGLEPATRLELMLLAARCDEALGEREAALARYHEVLLIDPRHAESLDAVGAARRRTLHARMESLVAERDFAAAVAALAELARLEPAAEAGAQYLYAAAVIRRDHLDDRRGALELVDRALAVAPELPRAFDTAFRLRQDTGDLAGLLRQLRGALDRLGPGDANADKARLWQQVGEIALQRGADPATALCAFSAADALVPGDRAREDLVARLSVEVGTGAVDKALAAHQRLIDREPDRPAPYHSLARLCQDIGATDRLWWTTAALIVLDDVKPDLLRFYEQHRAAQLGPVRGTITPELWTLLGHPDQDRPIEALLRLAGPALAWRTARTHAAAGLDLRRRVIAGKGQNGAPSAGLPTRAAFGPAEWFPALVLKYVARTLDVAAPDLFVDETAAAGLGSHNLRDGRELAPAFVLGPELVRRPSEPEVVFELGRATALLRPEWMLRLALPTRATLELAVRVALAVGGASSPAGDDDETQRLAGQLRATLPADAQDQLRIVARSFVADRGGVIDVRRWLAAGELGAARAALAITGDLAAAARVLGADTGPGGGISQQDRRRDLLAFAVSEEHMAVRRALGLGVAEGPTVAGSATVSTTARSSNHV